MLASMAPGIQWVRPGLLLSLAQVIAEVSVPHAEHRISFAQRGSELLISSRHDEVAAKRPVMHFF